MSFQFTLLLFLLSIASQIHAKTRIAYYKISDAAEYTDVDWKLDIEAAKKEDISVFALNIAQNDNLNEQSISLAFEIAGDLDFDLFFSFDYENTQHEINTDVIELIQKYNISPAYFKHDSSPLVGTYKDSNQIFDLTTIEQQTNCIFVPACAQKIEESSNDDVDFLEWTFWQVGQDSARRDDCSSIAENSSNETSAIDLSVHASKKGSNSEAIEPSATAADLIMPLSSLDSTATRPSEQDRITAEREQTAHSSQETKITSIAHDARSSQATDPLKDETTIDETAKTHPIIGVGPLELSDFSTKTALPRLSTDASDADSPNAHIITSDTSLISSLANSTHNAPLQGTPTQNPNPGTTTGTVGPMLSSNTTSERGTDQISGTQNPSSNTQAKTSPTLDVSLSSVALASSTDPAAEPTSEPEPTETSDDSGLAIVLPVPVPLPNKPDAPAAPKPPPLPALPALPKPPPLPKRPKPPPLPQRPKPPPLPQRPQPPPLPKRPKPPPLPKRPSPDSPTEPPNPENTSPPETVTESPTDSPTDSPTVTVSTTTCDSESSVITFTVVRVLATLSDNYFTIPTLTQTSLSTKEITGTGCIHETGGVTTTTEINVCTKLAASDRIMRESSSSQELDEENVCEGPAVIMPNDMRNTKRLKAYLEEHAYSYMEISAPSLGITAYFYVRRWLAYEHYKELYDWTEDDGVMHIYYSHPPPETYDDASSSSDFSDEPRIPEKFGRKFRVNRNYELAHISLRPKHTLLNERIIERGNLYFKHYSHNSQGEGQTVYILENDFHEHPEVPTTNVDYLFLGIQWDMDGEIQSLDHGTHVTSKVIGKTVGISTRANIRIVEKPKRDDYMAREKIIESFVIVCESVFKNSEQGQAVVNYSGGLPESIFDRRIERRLLEILMELNKLDVSIVLATGNDGFDKPIESLPQRFASSDTMSRLEWAKFSSDKRADLQRLLDNIILVGSTDPYGNAAEHSQRVFKDGSSPEENLVYAPGVYIAVPKLPANGAEPFDHKDGTSLSAPLVAGLIAYLRGLPSEWKDGLKSATQIKELVRTLAYKKIYNDAKDHENKAGDVPTIWNGMVGEKNCFLDRPFDGDDFCPEAPSSDSDENEDSEEDPDDERIEEDCDPTMLHCSESSDSTTTIRTMATSTSGTSTSSLPTSLHKILSSVERSGTSETSTVPVSEKTAIPDASSQTTTVICESTSNESAYTMDRKRAKIAIEEFCRFYDRHQLWAHGRGMKHKEIRETESRISLFVGVSTDHACEGASGKRNVEEGPCVTNFISAIYGCDTDATSAKKGGTALSNCVVYSVTAVGA